MKCTLNIESIPICDGGTYNTPMIDVTEVSLDHIEIAASVHQNDSSPPNVK